MSPTRRDLIRAAATGGVVAGMLGRGVQATPAESTSSAVNPKDLHVVGISMVAVGVTMSDGSHKVLSLMHANVDAPGEASGTFYDYNPANQDYKVKLPSELAAHGANYIAASTLAVVSLLHDGGHIDAW